jgi:hypothetical protein
VPNPPEDTDAQHEVAPLVKERQVLGHAPPRC